MRAGTEITGILPENAVNSSYPEKKTLIFLFPNGAEYVIIERIYPRKGRFLNEKETNRNGKDITAA